MEVSAALRPQPKGSENSVLQVWEGSMDFCHEKSLAFSPYLARPLRVFVLHKDVGGFHSKEEIMFLA